MTYLLNALYLGALFLAAPWLVYRAVRTGRYREGLAEKLLGCAPLRSGEGPCAWFHAVSVGEVNLLAPLLAEFRRRRPDVTCVLSTTTKTGMEVARRRYADLTLFHFPLDFSWAVGNAVARLRPDMIVLAELEVWPNLVRLAGRRGVPVVVANGRLSEKSFRGYSRLGALSRGAFAGLALVAAQDQATAIRFAALGTAAKRVWITGSMKFDGAVTDRDNPLTRRLAALAGIAADDVVFVAGSTQEGEEEAALATFRRLAESHPKLRLILVPRHPERFGDVARLLDASGLPWERRSELDDCSRGAERDKRSERRGRGEMGRQEESPRCQPPATPHRAAGRPRILLVDAVGELGGWWGTSQIAFVGGSFGSRGGQNMIEPAAYGAAVAFGPNTDNFRDIVAALRAHEAAVVVEGGEALYRFVARCLANPDWAAGLGERARQLVGEQLGAAGRTAALLMPLLPPPQQRVAA